MNKDDVRRQLCKMYGEIADSMDLKSLCICEDSIEPWTLPFEEITDIVVGKMWQLLTRPSVSLPEAESYWTRKVRCSPSMIRDWLRPEMLRFVAQAQREGCIPGEVEVDAWLCSLTSYDDSNPKGE